MAYDHAWIEKLANRFLDKINSKLTHVIRNGDPKHTYLGCVNLSFAYVEGKSTGLCFVYFKTTVQYALIVFWENLC